MSLIIMQKPEVHHPGLLNAFVTELACFLRLVRPIWEEVHGRSAFVYMLLMAAQLMVFFGIFIVCRGFMNRVGGGGGGVGGGGSKQMNVEHTIPPEILRSEEIQWFELV